MIIRLIVMLIIILIVIIGPLIIIVEWGGSMVGSLPSVQKVGGSNPTPVAT